MDPIKFFNTVRARFGALKTKQVEGFNTILNKWTESGLTDIRWLAYMLATAWHETAATMQPIKEYGLGKGRLYGKPDERTGKTYYGRGYVQLTWYDNYLKMSKILFGDNRLVIDPDLALDPKVAASIMFEGMTTGKSYAGDFTRKHLGNYFNKTVNDPFNARRIINGTDRAKLIAGYYDTFLAGLT